MLNKWLSVFVVYGLMANSVLANSLPSQLSGLDCLSINRDTVDITDFIEQGRFREAIEVEQAQLPKFAYNNSQPFVDYLAYASQVVALKKPLAELPCPLYTDTYKVIATQNNWSSINKVKHLVAPFELRQQNTDKAIVLIHGLTDSPYSFHDLAYFYYQQGFTVRTILLPGHGTAPSDLLDISYQDWQQATQYAIERTILDFDQVYLGGFSTGGALIFDYLMKKTSASEKIKGLMMWSPASKAKSELAWMAGYVDYLPFFDWVDKDADIDFAKYESFPFNAAAQVYKLMENVENSAEDLANFHDIPLFVVASEHDQTISTNATIKLLNQWHSAKNADKQTPTTFYYLGDIENAEVLLAATVNLISPTCEQGLCLTVHDIAHTAITNSPSNPHYGVAGQYRNCGHYISDIDKYLTCKTTNDIEMGEITENNLAQYPFIQRLTFNPHYQEMLVLMKTFIEQTAD